MRAAAVVVAVTLAACSFATMPGASAPPAGTHLHCGVRWLPPVADSLGVGASGFVGVAIVAESSFFHNDDWILSAVPFAIAAAYLASAVHGYREADRCGDLNADTDARLHEAQLSEHRREQRNAAWELTKNAMQAARAGDCAQVTATSERVRAIDSDFHAAVFSRDVAIARCIAQP